MIADELGAGKLEWCLEQLEVKELLAVFAQGYKELAKEQRRRDWKS